MDGGVGEARRGLSVWQTPEFAYVFSIIVIICETISAIFVIFAAYFRSQQFIVSTFLMAGFITLVLAFVLAPVVLFGLSRVVVYVMRLAISLLLVWISLGFIVYVTYVSNNEAMMMAATVSLVLFMALAVVFFIASWLGRAILNMIKEHNMMIERIEGLLGRVSVNIPPDDAAQLAWFMGATKTSWSIFIRNVVMERADVARVLYKALVVTMIFFVISWGMAVGGDIRGFLSQYGIFLMLGLGIFTAIIVAIDYARLKRLRAEILRAI